VNDSMKHTLDHSVQYLKGIGEKRAAALAENNIHTVWDLLEYFPRRYLDRTKMPAIRDVKPEDVVTVIGKIITCGIQKGRRTRFLVTLSDGTGYLSCVWFHQVNYWHKKFSVGQVLAVSGKVGYFGGKQMVHPEFDVLSEDGDDLENQLLNTGKIIPLYSSSEVLSRMGLDSRGIRKIIRSVLKSHLREVDEVLPVTILEKHNLLPFQQAIETIHFPANFDVLKQAQHRLKFNELFFLEFMLALRRQRMTSQQTGISFTEVGEKTRRLAEKLPFELTDAQKKVLREIRRDMKKPTPMYRLLQGDVGSGKTIVALVTMLIAIENGYQAALMAPTEILAEQHYLHFHRMLDDLHVPVKLLIGAPKTKERLELLDDIQSGACDIVIGTHALIQEAVKFKKLGLIVIDEQHRFGVAQRALMFDKGVNPDVLIMTATPIPRTLSLTVYGDLDVSRIDEMPAGRKKIITSWRYAEKRPEIYEFVRSKVELGQQAYIVFPLIEESEKLDLRAATESYDHLSQTVFANNKIALLHGRMKSDEKDEIMAAFKRGEIQVLVSTTVIEVGVDVPAASIMVIENAERFGLTQLHQLRGRVGRGAEQSYCIMIADSRLTDDARKRLDTMKETADGFQIAEVDLELRGPGEFFGTRQHGLPELKIADPLHDMPILLQARRAAFGALESVTEYEFMTQRIDKFSFYSDFRDKIQLMRIG